MKVQNQKSSNYRVEI